MASLDRIFQLLSDRRRRHIIYYLDERDEPASIEELTAHIADHDDTADAPESSDHRSRLDTELYHKHLPKMADEAFIQYDRDEGHLELDRLPPVANAILAVAKDLEYPQHTHE